MTRAQPQPGRAAGAPFDAHVRAALVGAPAALVGETAMRRMLAVAGVLPAAATDFFGFECRLGRPEPDADLLLSLKPAVGGVDVLAGTHELAALAPEIEQHPVWRRLRAFARAWKEPESALAAVTNAWLEFDLDSEPNGVPLPSVFFGTKALVGTGDRAAGGDGTGDGAGGGNGADPHAWMLDHALPLLRGAPLSASLRASVVRALDALPAGAHVFQVGVMLSRPGDAVRLCIRGLDDMAAYLMRAGWQSGRGALPGWAADLASHAQHVALDVDVEEGGVRERVGIECSFEQTPEGAERVSTFLRRLVEEGDCTPEKADALRGWTRLLHSGRGDWPEDLRARAAAFPTRTVSALWCWLYHVKVVEGGARPREAKAYLAVQQDWLDGPRVRDILQARQMMALTSALSRAFPEDPSPRQDPKP